MPTDTFFTRRRTVRRYSDRQLSDDTLRELFEEASHAPTTTGNMQLYSAVVTRSAEMKLGWLRCTSGSRSFRDVRRRSRCAPICAASRAGVRFPAPKPDSTICRCFSAGVLDAAMFAQQLCTAAEGRGLGTCYLGTTTYNAPEIAEALSLPQLVVPVTTVTVGYPDECPADPGRLPVEAIMHQESYEDFSDSRLRELYADKGRPPRGFAAVCRGKLA